MNKIAAVMLAIVAWAVFSGLVWVGMKTNDLEKAMCLKSGRMWSKGQCYDR